MALTLIVRSGDRDRAPRITFDAPRIVIGRGEGCEVRLPDPSVSHRHASIRQRGTEYIVLDEGSSNGTFVGPVRLSPQAPRVVRSGDLVRVGRVWLEVRVEQALPTPNAALATRELALSLVAAALAAEGAPAALRVRVVEGPGAGAELVIDEPGRAYVVGRMASADLNIDDPDLSRRHVELIRRAERLMVRDLGSKNGSKLGDRTLESKQESLWAKGESLVIGQSRLLYEDPVGAALEELEHAADERIKESELIEPPTAGDSSGAAETAVARKDPPVAPRRRLPEGTAPRGWTPIDFIVALLALVVIALSIAGLVWLMRSG